TFDCRMPFCETRSRNDHRRRRDHREDEAGGPLSQGLDRWTDHREPAAGLDRGGGAEGWSVVSVFEDAGVSGAKGRDKRPGFDAMLKDAMRRRFDVLMFWSIDRLGRSTATVATALAELEAAGVAIYADKEGMDATTPHGKAMLQMAVVFAELERGIIRERVKAGLARARAQGIALGRPRVPGKVETA